MLPAARVRIDVGDHAAIEDGWGVSERTSALQPSFAACRRGALRLTQRSTAAAVLDSTVDRRRDIQCRSGHAGAVLVAARLAADLPGPADQAHAVTLYRPAPSTEPAAAQPRSRGIVRIEQRVDDFQELCRARIATLRIGQRAFAEVLLADRRPSAVVSKGSYNIAPPTTHHPAVSHDHLLCNPS